MQHDNQRRALMKAALAGAVLGTVATPARAEVVRIGHVGLSFYEATAHVIRWFLERQGWNTGMESGSHSKIFPKIAKGDVDLFVAAWLPHAHADYWSEYGRDLVKVSTLFEDAQLYWAVPDYVPASEVRSVQDLLKPEVAARMVKTVRGTLPDSGLMIGSQKILEHYKLGDAGYELAPGPAAEWIANCDARIAAKEWFVMPLWRPQYLNRKYKFRVLEEPKTFLGGPNTAYLVASQDFWGRLTKKEKALLSRIELSNRSVTTMDYWVNVEGMSTSAAARQWIGMNADTVSFWITGTEE